ncbi:unnamed protein product [Absidia cylindrospora]
MIMTKKDKKMIDDVMNTTKGMPPPGTDAEYNQNMTDQAINHCLRQSPLTFDFLKEALNQPLENLLTFIWTYHVDDATTTTSERENVQLLKYILIDYHANCTKPATTNPTSFSENILPIFKYFSAVTGLLSSNWCEKSSMSDKPLMMDGIGTSVKDKAKRVLIKCCGDVDDNHTLELLQCTINCLELEMKHYPLASMATFKKRRMISIQSTGHQITLIATGLGNDFDSHTEQRSAIVPRYWEDRKYWIKWMELLLKLKELLLEQEALTEVLKDEQVGLVMVEKNDMVKSMALNT